MGVPYKFAGRSGNVPASYLDDNFDYVLNSTLLNVQSYGATGDGTTDDTAAIQAAINDARSNLAYGLSSGTANRAGIFLPAGNYKITSSLDVTTLGTVKGFVIQGAGQLQTVLLGELTDGPCPVLDCTGVGNLEISELSIRGQSSGLQSCCLLLAQSFNSTSQNYNPNITRCLFTNSISAPNYVGAVVWQNADLGVFDECLIQDSHTFVGRYLPVRHGGTAAAGGSNTITLDGGASAVNGAYVGYSISIINGTGVGQCQAVTGYVGSTKVATMTGAWSVTPDSTSVFRVWAIKSKYQLIPALGDQTKVQFFNCSLYGPVGIVGTQFEQLDVSGCYVATAAASDSRNSAIYIQVVNPYSTNPCMICGINFRTENQNNNSTQYTISTENSSTAVQLFGATPNIQNPTNTTTGAHFNDAPGGAFANVTIYGQDGLSVDALFNQTSASNGHLIGSMSIPPGTIAGFAAVIFDWQYPSYDSAWITALSGKTPFGFCRGILKLDLGVSNILAFDKMTAAPQFRLVGGSSLPPATYNLYVGGSGSAVQQTYTIEALSPETTSGRLVRVMRVKVGGTTSAICSGFLVYVKQGATSFSAAVNSSVALSANEAWNVEFDLQFTSNAGTSASLSGVLTHGSVTQVLYGNGGFITSPFDPSQAFTVELWPNSAVSNPLGISLFTREFL